MHSLGKRQIAQVDFSPFISQGILLRIDAIVHEETIITANKETTD